MPTLERDEATIHYEVHGEGYPLMLFAPGGMHSVAQMWHEAPHAPGNPMPWIDPRAVLADQFTVIAMDQRNAGSSRAPIRVGDGWHSYTEDHIALLDTLGLDRTHVMGGCIGSSYGLSMCQAAPDRITAAVLQNPIGLSSDNRQAFIGMFDSWVEQRRESGDEVSDEAVDSFRQGMFGGDFVFSVDRDFVRNCPVPLLVLAGSDDFHPRAVAEEIAELAPRAELVIEWAGPERYESTGQKVREFLLAHTP